jgi:hypothetical protein
MGSPERRMREGDRNYSPQVPRRNPCLYSLGNDHFGSPSDALGSLLLPIALSSFIALDNYIHSPRAPPSQTFLEGWAHDSCFSDTKWLSEFINPWHRAALVPIRHRIIDWLVNFRIWFKVIGMVAKFLLTSGLLSSSVYSGFRNNSNVK